jgi:hypothetical protein
MAFRQLFGSVAAFLAVGLLATSFWSLMYSRVGLRHISLPPWIGLSAYCFWRGLEVPYDRRKRVILWFALGGLCTGTMLYTYFASRVVPFVYVAFTLYLLVFRREMLRGRWLGLLLFFVLPALIVTPIMLYLRQHPELEQRLGQVGGELFTALRAGDFKPVFQAVIDTLKMFSFQGDPEWLYNISGRPVFDPATSLLFYVGVLISIWHWRDPKRAFILLWLALGIAPAMLSWPPGSLGHTIAAQPVTFCFPALALVAGLQWAEKVKPGWVLWGARALCTVAMLFFVFDNGYDYFVRWPRFPEVRHEYQAPITAVARYLQRHSDATSACISAPYVDYWNPWSRMNFDLYFQSDDVRVCWFNGSSSILYPNGEALFFLPDHISYSSELDDDLGSLLMAEAEPIEIGYMAWDGSTFDLYRWPAPDQFAQRLTLASTQLWASSEGPYVAGESEKQRQMLDVPLDFGHRLLLLGYTFDRTQVAAGESWRIKTYWRVLMTPSPKAIDPLAIFVHVLDENNTVKAGWDGLYVPPEGWREGDVFMHIHTLTLPPDMPAGPQRTELGVYSPITLERLAPFTGVGDETAPHHRVLLRPLNILSNAQ